MSASWEDESKVSEYLERLDRLTARRAGEAELVEALPSSVERMLDLGCGDGRLIDVVRSARPEVEAIGVDNSAPMLARARNRFDADAKVKLVEHDLALDLPPLDVFDVVVSGFAIHHLAHERKRSLYREISDLLR